MPSTKLPDLTATTDSDLEIRRFQCRHIFTNGRRCGSPCLREQHFCFYHHRARKPEPLPSPYDAFLAPNQSSFELEIPEDASSIQQSIGRIMRQLAANALDPRRAGLLLYALQIASQNLKAQAPKPQHPKARPVPPEPTVEEIVDDPLLGPIAPETEYEEPEEQHTGGYRTVARWLREIKGAQSISAAAEAPSLSDTPARIEAANDRKSTSQRRAERRAHLADRLRQRHRRTSRR